MTISIHALREEGDVLPPLEPPQLYTFLSTPSARRATNVQTVLFSRFLISIHALREEGDYGNAELESSMDISIHALREEGDSG